MSAFLGRFSRILALLVGLGLIAPLAGCGGDEPTSDKPPWEGRSSRKKKATKKAVTAKDQAYKPQPKKEWEAIRPYFLGKNGFVKRLERKIDSPSVAYQYKDAFASNADKFFPDETEIVRGKVKEKDTKLLTGKSKGSLKREKTAEERAIEGILAGILPPDKKAKQKDDLAGPQPTALTSKPLSEYTFTMILTGVANPKAVVDTPDGQTLEVTRNQKIGSEGGYIEDILKQKVLVRLPNDPKLLEISLAPGSLADSLLLNQN